MTERLTWKEEHRRIGEIIDHTSKLAYAGEWATLDAYVRDYDYENDSDGLWATSVLRSCYAMRDQLPSYADAVNRARTLHPEEPDLLRGLY